MTERPALAWVLDLDADLELAGAAATDAMRARMTAIRDRLAETLPPGDVVLDRDPDSAARGLEGRCWCPTPSALRRLARAGARVPAAPSLEVLRRVNERGFAWSIAQLPEAERCTDEDVASRALSRPGRWLAKRAFTFAGTGQRRVDGGRLTDADRSWIRASLRRGAVYVEPRLEIGLEIGLHGLLSLAGETRRGAPTVQDVDAAGQWRRSQLASPDALTDAERAALFDAFDRATEALRDAGYFGPFGIDAFRGSDGAFHPSSELNARYSMGWATGMGGWS